MSDLEENNDNVPNEPIWENLEVPNLASLPHTNPFRVPQNYFQELPQRIQNCVFLTELKATNETDFTIPANYFENLNTQIEGKLVEENLKSLVSGAGFSTPANYFENLNKAILTKTIFQENKPKVIKLWQTNLFRYVSAACVIVLIASGLYYNNYNEAQQPLTADLLSENMLYDIDESVIRAHIQESQTTTNTAATEAEMEVYILGNLSSNDITNNL